MTSVPPMQIDEPPPSKKKSPWVWIVGGCGLLLLVGGIAVAGFLWWGYHKAKNYADEVLESGSGNMKNVGQLWSDVPPMEGMDQSQQIDMPVALKVIARKMLDGMMRGVNDGKDAGNWDFNGFSLKGKQPTDLEEFYNTDRMKEYGWKPEGGCMNTNFDLSANQAIICAFQKQEGDKTTGLLMIAAPDQEQKATSVFFIRQEAQEKT